MSEPSTAKQQRAWTWVCGLSSWLFLVVVATEAAHIRVGLGRWPKPMFDDLHTWAFRMHDWAVAGSLIFALYLAAPLWLVFLCFRWLRLSKQTHLVQAIVYGLGWLLAILAAKYDPTTFTEWLLD